MNTGNKVRHFLVRYNKLSSLFKFRIPRMSAQNMDSNAQQGFPTLCSNGCGFFSSVDSKGLCSVCYKEEQKKNAPPTQSTTTTTTTSTSTNTSKSDLHQPTTLSENSINVESCCSRNKNCLWFSKH